MHARPIVFSGDSIAKATTNKSQKVSMKILCSEFSIKQESSHHAISWALQTRQQTNQAHWGPMQSRRHPPNLAMGDHMMGGYQRGAMNNSAEMPLFVVLVTGEARFKLFDQLLISLWGQLACLDPLVEFKLECSRSHQTTPTVFSGSCRHTRTDTPFELNFCHYNATHNLPHHQILQDLSVAQAASERSNNRSFKHSLGQLEPAQVQDHGTKFDILETTKPLPTAQSYETVVL